MANLNEELIQTALCRYGMMSFFKNDDIISRSLVEYGEWAQREIAFLESLMITGDTVLDVGAFIGTHTLAFARKVGSSGRVYAFEPQPAYFEALKKNVDQNALANVRVLNLAVSDNVGRLEIPEIDTAHRGNFGGTGILKPGSAEGDPPSRSTIDVTTIDQLGINSCSLIKIDAEDMEINVLKGARKTLGAMRPVVFAECNSLEYGWPVAELSREEGYHPYLLNVLAYNPDNFRQSRNNFFGDLREAGLILIPSEQLAAIQERLSEGHRFSQLIPISCIDDLALALLKKPQYKYEVMPATKAATVLGNEFWANEVEVKQFREKIQFGEASLARSAEKIVRLEAERQDLCNELATVKENYGQTVQELQESRAVLNQIYASRGWKALSAYYKLRQKLLPEGSWRQIIARRVLHLVLCRRKM
jgi:FkbM family methyltransferase